MGRLQFEALFCFFAKLQIYQMMKNKPGTRYELLEVFRSLPKLMLTNENESILTLVTEYIFGCTPIQCKLADDVALTPQEVDAVEAIIDKLEKDYPIQYILGEAHFYDLKFRVNPSVLIPRQETEELVHWILADVADKKANLNLVDLGTGSGCIPVSLKKNLPGATVFGIDVSADALRVASENAFMNRAEVTFYRADVLNQPEWPLEKTDIIVSNPPYVKEDEKAEMATNVLDHEPHMALFVENENPLVFYEAIADLAKQHLAKDGKLYFEINQYLGAETVELLEQKGFKAELRKDLNGNDRMVKAVLI